MFETVINEKNAHNTTIRNVLEMLGMFVINLTP